MYEGISPQSSVQKGFLRVKPEHDRFVFQTRQYLEHHLTQMDAYQLFQKTQKGKECINLAQLNNIYFLIIL